MLCSSGSSLNYLRDTQKVDFKLVPSIITFESENDNDNYLNIEDDECEGGNDVIKIFYKIFYNSPQE